MEKVGGAGYVAGLVDGVPRTTNVEHYARIVREKATLRRLIEVSNRTLEDAYAATEDVAQVIDTAEARLMMVPMAEARRSPTAARHAPVKKALDKVRRSWVMPTARVRRFSSGAIILGQK